MRPESAERLARAQADARRALDRVSMLGTVRHLFPTNRVHSFVQRIQPEDMTMAKQPAKKTQDATEAAQDNLRMSSPSQTAGMAQEDARDTNAAGERKGEPFVHRLGTADEEGEGYRPDPGPPPARPTYSGDRANTQVDQLLFAAEAEDREAIMAVDTKGQPPAIAQFKANLLQWLDDLELYRGTSRMPEGQPVADTDAIGDEVDENTEARAAQRAEEEAGRPTDDGGPDTGGTGSQ